MFKAIKYIADLVRRNNEYQRVVADILLKLDKPTTLFVKSDIDDVDFALCEIEKFLKENADLKEKFGRFRNDLFALVEKCQYTQYREGEQPKIQGDQTKPIFEYIDSLQKDITTLIKERNEGIQIKR